MKIRQIKCDVCGKVAVDGQGDIISLNKPTYITVKLKGYGIRHNLDREYDICEECLWNGIIIDQIDKHLRIYSRKEIPRNER